jgi:high-affinity nickel-transport protein
VAAIHPLLSWPTLTICATAFVLGCRHAFDWDHIAAITDLTASNSGQGTEGGGKRALHRHGSRLGLALWYCIGHGLVIALIGLLVVVLGLHLPPTIDRVFESIVGGTLLILGAFVLWQLGRDRGEYRYSGRIRLLIGVTRRAWARARRRGAGPADPLDDLTARSAFAVGVLHGTGAETPSQVVLFAGAATSGSKAAATAILLASIFGMIISDLGIAASWLTGLLGARRAPRAQVVLGALTGTSSLVIGGLFVFGQASTLPAIFGG